jgi:hypothetical protein
MWDTFAFNCFDVKVRPGTPGLTNNPGLHRQSNLKSPQTTCYCNFFIHLYSAIAVLAPCPRTQGYRKEPLFHTKRRSGRDRESNPGHLLARRSAIHYALVVVFELSAKLSLKALIYILIIVPITPEIFEIDLSVYSYDIKLKRYHT